MPDFLDDGRLAIWKFPGFGGYTPADRQGAYIDKAFEMIRQHGSAVLILDNRDNGGGSDSLGARLFSYFADQRFQYYKDLIANDLTFHFLRYATPSEPLPKDEFARRPDGKYEWVKHPNWGTLEPHEPNFSGKTYVLINGGCFSTCAEFISTMHYYRKAVFVGEEVGGAYYGNSSGIRYMVTLPRTKLELELPVIGYYLNVRGYAYSDRGVMPDFPINPEISDVLAGKDPAMDQALSLARAHLIEK
jgi:C-terminal processing protease CtpA/Prc